MYRFDSDLGHKRLLLKAGGVLVCEHGECIRQSEQAKMPTHCEVVWRCLSKPLARFFGALQVTRSQALKARVRVGVSVHLSHSGLFFTLKLKPCAPKAYHSEFSLHANFSGTKAYNSKGQSESVCVGVIYPTHSLSHSHSHSYLPSL